MGPEIAATYFGVMTDVAGFGWNDLDHDRLDEIVAAHPRDDFKNEFLKSYFDGFKDRPETTIGTVNVDVVEHFLPGFHRTTMQDVAREAGMSAGNLYRYFASKEALVSGMIERDR